VLKSTWHIVSTYAQRVSLTMGQRSSNGQNYATVCPNLTYLRHHSRPVWDDGWHRVCVWQNETGRLQLEGCVCEDYYRVRDLLYEQFAIVWATTWHGSSQYCWQSATTSRQIDGACETSRCVELHKFDGYVFHFIKKNHLVSLW